MEGKGRYVGGVDDYRNEFQVEFVLSAAEDPFELKFPDYKDGTIIYVPQYQYKRVYGDEIPLPNEGFCWGRSDQLCGRSLYWAWSAAIAWNKLRLKIIQSRLTK